MTAAPANTAVVEAVVVPGTSEGSKKTYGQILKSTALIGGSSAVNILFAVIRSKAIAMMLGPSGVGLMGLYTSIIDIAQTVAGLGVQASGVRQIAESAGSCAGERIACTATVLRRVSIVLGIAGAALLALFSAPVAFLTFGDHQHALGVALLAAAVFFNLVSASQVALLQGLRRIVDLARFNMLSAFFSTAISVPLVFFFGAAGIVPSLITMAAISVAISWRYSRKASVRSARLSLRAISRESSELLRLGVVFMASALFSVGAAYAIRIIILREDGVEAAGLYQAAWSLGGIYAGFILQAMGTDFLPRLTAAAKNHTECNRLVNEQAEVSILLAGPGVLATLTLAPIVISVFYTPEFHPAINLLRWISLGMMLRIVSWPMGYIIIAKGARKAFFFADAAATIVNIGLAWLLVPVLGVTGAGVAFFGLYIWHSLFVYAIVRRLTGFSWSSVNLALGGIFFTASAAVFGSFALFSFWTATLFGVAVTLVCGLYAVRMLFRLLPQEILPNPLRTVSRRFAALTK